MRLRYIPNVIINELCHADSLLNKRKIPDLSGIGDLKNSIHPESPMTAKIFGNSLVPFAQESIDFQFYFVHQKLHFQLEDDIVCFSELSGQQIVLKEPISMFVNLSQIRISV